MGTRTLPWV